MPRLKLQGQENTGKDLQSLQRKSENWPIDRAKAAKEINNLIGVSLEDIQTGQKTVSEGKEGLDQSKLQIDNMLQKLQSDSNVNLDEITEAFKAVSQLIQEGEGQMNEIKNDIETMPSLVHYKLPKGRNLLVV